MNPAELLDTYLGQGQAMQLATIRGDQPWICTVHFVSDDAHNLYWLSLPSRRHSQEAEAHTKAAAAIAVKTDNPVIGVQIEGEVSAVRDLATVQKVMSKYVAKYGKGTQFAELFAAGTNEHTMYRLTPKSVVIFDEVNFAGSPRQVIAF